MMTNKATHKIIMRIMAAMIFTFHTISTMSQTITANFSKDDSSKPYPKYEVRAMWLTTIGGIDWPHSYAKDTSPATIQKQQQELRNILDKLKQANINTILLQTRVRATTIYPCDMEPWDGCLSGNPGTSPGYDALKYAIDECHKRGMECHAWVVTIPIGKWNGAGCKNLRKTHPELLRKIGEEGYMNPEHLGTADYLARICGDITRRYDIDGIHLDYIRYPETWTIRSSKGGKEGDLRNPDARRNCITRIVKAIHNAVKSQKPWVKMSCSPIGKYSDLTRYSSHGWNALNTVCQDAQAWLRDGLMDQLYPMMYFRDNQFFPFAIDWAESSYGKTIAPGLGIYFLDPREGKWQKDDVARQMQVLRQLGLGHTYFRSDFFTRNVKDIYTYACNNIDNYPALVPPMTWAENRKPSPPQQINVTFANITQLSWQGTSPYYNIYASKEYPVDTDDPRNLIAQRVARHSMDIETDKEYYYAVTAMDRYGNESLPTQSWQKARGNKQQLLKNDGTTLLLPSHASLTDAGYVAIESLQGNLITTLPFNKNGINIQSLPEGAYCIRTLGKKGITHKLGMFTIKR